LVGQIARALAVFCVDEVVIFDDGQATTSNHDVEVIQQASYTGYTDPNYFLAHILAYLETPPYLRKQLFPMHPDLRLAGTLPSLDMPHHLRRTDWCQYREGIATSQDVTTKTRGNPVKKLKPKVSKGMTRVDTGLHQAVYIPIAAPPQSRLTVKFRDFDFLNIPSGELTATAVAPSIPREEAGYYWGYSTRSASSLSTVLTECPFDGGYDLTIGTSERGISLSDLNESRAKAQADPEFRHMMVVFGGVAGLEVAVKADEQLAQLGVHGPEALFDHWVNLVPGQGSRTIRTEEAVWLGLMGLRDLVLKNGL
jgi:predicted SPOUT superfamily RNA methylase MTH1